MGFKKAQNIHFHHGYFSILWYTAILESFVKEKFYYYLVEFNDYLTYKYYLLCSIAVIRKNISRLFNNAFFHMLSYCFLELCYCCLASRIKRINEHYHKKHIFRK